MKSIFIILLLSFLFTFSVRAQFIKSYGIIGGASLSNESWTYTNYSTSITPDNRWGAVAGVYAGIYELPHLSFIAECDYIQKGFSETLPVTTTEQPEGTGQYITLKPRIDYLSIPLLAKARFDLGNFSPYALGGIRFDFVMHKEAQYYESIMNNYNSFEFGLTLGVGASYKISSIKLLTEARFSPNLTPIFQNSFVRITEHSF